MSESTRNISDRAGALLSEFLDSKTSNLIASTLLVKRAKPCPNMSRPAPVHHFSIVLHGNHAVPNALPLTADTLKLRSDELAAFLTLQEPCDWVFQAELGEELGHLHLQGYLYLKGKANHKERPEALQARMQSEGLNVTVRAASARGVTELKKYCSKSKTRFADPVWSSELLRDSMMDLQPKDYSGLFAMIESPDNVMKWQRNALRIFECPADPRAIHWFWSELEHVGKSIFVEYLRAKYGATVFTQGKAADVARIIANKSASQRRVFVFDIPRAGADDNGWREIYSIMEQMNNGQMTSTKYEPKDLKFDTPHVIMFSNQPGERHKISKDRVKNYKIMQQAPKDERKEMVRPVFDDDAFEMDDETERQNNKNREDAKKREEANLAADQVAALVQEAKHKRKYADQEGVEEEDMFGFGAQWEAQQRAMQALDEGELVPADFHWQPEDIDQAAWAAAAEQGPGKRQKVVIELE